LNAPNFIHPSLFELRKDEIVKLKGEENVDKSDYYKSNIDLMEYDKNVIQDWYSI